MRTFPTLALVLLLPLAPAFAQAAPPSAAELLQPPAEAAVSASGLAWQILAAGKGPLRPGPTDYVTVHYTIWTPEGKVVDTTLDKDGPLTLAVDRVMKGMGEGVQLMAVGERRRLWLPKGLGFPPGRGLPSGKLVLDLELLNADPPPSQAPADVAQIPADAILLRSGLAYRILRHGEGTLHPGRRDTVSVHYSGWTADGKAFDSSLPKRTPSTFALNEVIKGWTEGIRLLVKGDKARFWIPEKLAYRGEEGKPAGTLVFDVELLGFWP